MYSRTNKVGIYFQQKSFVKFKQIIAYRSFIVMSFPH